MFFRNREIFIILFLFLIFTTLSFSQSKKPSLAILGFIDTSGNESSFNVMLNTSLANFLSRIPELEIVFPERVKEVVKKYDFLEKRNLDIQMAGDIGVELKANQILVGDYYVDRKAKTIKVNIYVYDVAKMELKLKREYNGSISADFFETVDKINSIVASLLLAREVRIGKLIVEVDSEGEYELFLNRRFEKKIKKQDGFSARVLAGVPINVSIKKLGIKEEVYADRIVVKNNDTYYINYKPHGNVTIKAEGLEGFEVYCNELIKGNVSQKGILEIRGLEINKEYVFYLKKSKRLTEKKKVYVEEGKNYTLDFSKEKIDLSQKKGFNYRWIGYTLIGVGTLSGGLGIYFDSQAKSSFEEAKQAYSKYLENGSSSDWDNCIRKLTLAKENVGYRDIWYITGGITLGLGLLISFVPMPFMENFSFFISDNYFGVSYKF